MATAGGAAEFDALVALAQRQQRAGQLAEVEATYRKILALRPDHAVSHHDLGNILLRQGRLDQAVAQFERAIDLQPDFIQAHNNLGTLLWERGQLDQARLRLEHAIALRPDFAEARYNLGNVLKDLGKLDAAVAQYQKAVTLKPGLFQAHTNLGNVYKEQGHLAEAAACYRHAVASGPRYPEAYNNLGKLLYEEGRFDEAAALYEQALAIKPDYAEALYNRANLKTFRPDDADLAALEAFAADPARVPPGKLHYIHFALGKALDDVGDYPLAFEHWRQANALIRRQVKYDEARHQRDCREIAQWFDAQQLDRFAGLGDPSPVPIFVLGMPRSGSTLVEQILASHPQVHAAGELHNLAHLIQELSDYSGRQIPVPSWIEKADSGSLRRLGQAYLASLPALADGQTRIVDKELINFLRIGLIRLILPNARVIHTVRDPVDTCVSCFSRYFSDLPFSYDLGELGRFYRSYYELMAHWRKVLPAGAMLDVAYEDVVGDLERQARRLIDYCGLPWDDRCLRFHETQRPIATASTAQVRRPLYRSSIARWRRYETYLQPLLAELESCRRS